MAALFVSDLHLAPDNPGPLQSFIQLLEGRARAADRLFILGDLFELWIGDDYVDPAFEPLLDALQACTRSGTPVLLMHGNRDFLIGERFLRRSGCTRLDDPTLVELYGRRVLLMHGDLLCTDDVDYQRLRRQFRDPAWQRQVLQRPVAERLAMARQARAASDQATRDKPQAIMDVNPDAVVAALRESGADLLVHGHTHRPATHRLQVDGRAVQRIVLGDWYRAGSVLVLDAGGIETVSLL